MHPYLFVYSHVLLRDGVRSEKCVTWWCTSITGPHTPGWHSCSWLQACPARHRTKWTGPIEARRMQQRHRKLEMDEAAARRARSCSKAGVMCGQKSTCSDNRKCSVGDPGPRAVVLTRCRHCIRTRDVSRSTVLPVPRSLGDRRPSAPW